MSTLQVANIHFESTQNNRVQYFGSNNLALVVGGANAIVSNTTVTAISGVANVSGNLVISGVIANGSIGSATQVLTSNGTGTYWAAATSGKNYAITGSLQKSSFVDATTYYFGAHPQSTLITTAGLNRVYVPAAGTISAVYFSIYNNAGIQGTAEPSPVYLRLNNTTDYLIDNFVLSMASSAASYYANTTISVSVNAGDYFEFKQISNTWVTNPTNIQYGWNVYIT